MTPSSFQHAIGCDGCYQMLGIRVGVYQYCDVQQESAGKLPYAAMYSHIQSTTSALQGGIQVPTEMWGGEFSFLLLIPASHFPPPRSYEP